MGALKYKNIMEWLHDSDAYTLGRPPTSPVNPGATNDIAKCDAHVTVIHTDPFLFLQELSLVRRSPGPFYCYGKQQTRELPHETLMH